MQNKANFVIPERCTVGGGQSRQSTVHRRWTSVLRVFVIVLGDLAPSLCRNHDEQK